jgi:hypothetical protein
MLLVTASPPNLLRQLWVAAGGKGRKAIMEGQLKRPKGFDLDSAGRLGR